MSGNLGDVRYKFTCLVEGNQNFEGIRHRSLELTPFE